MSQSSCIALISTPGNFLSVSLRGPLMTTGKATLVRGLPWGPHDFYYLVHSSSLQSTLIYNPQKQKSITHVDFYVSFSVIYHPEDVWLA